MTKGKRVVTILWALLLFGFTVYAALDTFVIAHSYAVVEAQDTEIESTPSIAATVTETGTDALSLDAGNTAVPTAEAKIVSTENSYSDSNVTITIQEMRAYDSTIYVADVVLSSPEYLQTAFANSQYPTLNAPCATAERLCATVLSLPMHPYIEPQDIERVSECLLAIKS